MKALTSEEIQFGYLAYNLLIQYGLSGSRKIMERLYVLEISFSHTWIVPFSCRNRIDCDILSLHLEPLGVAMPYPFESSKPPI